MIFVTNSLVSVGDPQKLQIIAPKGFGIFFFVVLSVVPQCSVRSFWVVTTGKL
jgi:hypothetical protein